MNPGLKINSQVLHILHPLRVFSFLLLLFKNSTNGGYNESDWGQRLEDLKAEMWRLLFLYKAHSLF